MLSNNINTKDNKDNLMNFKVLSRYDDLFTDIFLDNMFLWFTTIKMNNDHRKPRVPNSKILGIIQKNILEKARPMDAVTELLAMDYFKQYLIAKNQKQIQEFIQHLKRYLYMYMPNAGYEVGDTRRYGSNGRRVEACLVATKDWQVGDEMRLLTGMIACLDPKDDAELKRGNRDFSVMWSTRKNCSCLFLGPARFANHDCESNCKFIALGQNSITFKVLRNIQCGQEITVYYGKHYFGENNGECRCITCENLSMGYFASLETKETTPIDIKDQDQGGTRRSTRKRKSAAHDEYVDYSPTSSTNLSTRRLKRASIEPSPKPSNSLEDLIEEQQQQQQQQQQMELDSRIAVKKEATTPPPISPTTVTTERMARLKVMSIDFLCGRDEEMSPVSKERRLSDCSLLDLLVDAAMDAPYLHSEEQLYHPSGQITVVVNPEIHRDATHRVYMQQQQHQEKQIQQQQQKQLQSSRHSKDSLTQPDSPQSASLDSSESKADSAVSLSPRIQPTSIKNEPDHYWRREMDDGLFENNDDFDDFLDNVSDLSSVGSAELSLWSTEEEEEEEEQEQEKVAPVGKTKKSASLVHQQQASLACIACARPLKKKDISEQVGGADMSITNELATWAWSPSAMFTDWKPERCPRCERHFVIFEQEWPNRKLKKKKPVLEDGNEKLKKTSRKTKKKPLANKKSTLSSSPVVARVAETVAVASVVIAPPAPGTPVYQMQDDPDDLNYIPPSPLSDSHYEDGPF